MSTTERDDLSDSDDVWEHLDERAAAIEAITTRPVSAKRRFLRRFLKQKLAVVSLAFILLLVFVAIFGPWITPHDPNTQDLSVVLSGPGHGRLLGADELGRDVVSRLIVGTRVSLLAAAQATIISLFLGVPIGLFCGYLGGKVDRAVMLLNDAMMSLPALILAIAIVGVLGPGLTNAMVAVGIVFTPRVLRLVRASVLEVKEETYIEASLSIGTSTARILRRHVLPNVLSPLIVASSLNVARAMLAEASLSFLGLGVQPPQASWGAMLGRAFRYTDQAPYLIYYPGICIALAVLAFNLLGDGIRDSLGKEIRRS